MSELKPCPFCGKIPSLDRGGFGEIAVKCFHSDCPTNPGAWFTTEEPAIALWNRRASDLTPSERETIKQVRDGALLLFERFTQTGAVPRWEVWNLASLLSHIADAKPEPDRGAMLLPTGDEEPGFLGEAFLAVAELHKAGLKLTDDDVVPYIAQLIANWSKQGAARIARATEKVREAERP